MGSWFSFRNRRLFEETRGEVALSRRERQRCRAVDYCADWTTVPLDLVGPFSAQSAVPRDSPTYWVVQ
eukprot:2374116-Pyramimonas_sp.AAC.1